jgi:hypothetical protein
MNARLGKDVKKGVVTYVKRASHKMLANIEEDSQEEIPTGQH